MASEHTPTPWTFYTDEDGHVVAIVNAADSLGKRRIIVRPGVGNSRSDAENDANAAFIVRACNAHEDLVEALKQAQSVLAMLTTPDPQSTVINAWAQCVEAETRARTALALTEEPKS